MRAAAIAAAALIVGGAAQAPPPAQPGITRTELQRHDLSVADWETVQVQVDFAPGAVAARHMHPGDEIIYVLKGTLEYRIDGKPREILKAGDVLFIPRGKPHEAANVGLEPASELATYVVEKAKPLVIPVP